MHGLMTHQGFHQDPIISPLGTLTCWGKVIYVRGMEEYDVISLQSLIGAATDGSLQGLYGRLLFPFTKSSSLMDAHAQHAHM